MKEATRQQAKNIKISWNTHKFTSQQTWQYLEINYKLTSQQTWQYCHVHMCDYGRNLDRRLGDTDHLHTRLLNIYNYSAISSPHNSDITTAPA
jgi:hypothetical protein